MKLYKFLESNISSFDFETTGFNPWKGDHYFAYCIGIPIFDDAGSVIDAEVLVNRIDNRDTGENKAHHEFLLEYWKKQNNEKKKIRVIHNCKFEFHFLDKIGVNNFSDFDIHDTLIMSQLLSNLTQSHALDYLCWLYGGYPRDLDNQVKLAAKAVGNNYQKISKRLMTLYQIADGERPLLLEYLFIDKLKQDKNLYKDYLNEIELIKVTQKMEKRGILLDIDNIMQLKIWLSDQLDKVRTETFNLLREFVNLNSDDQVARLLFRKYKMNVIALTDTGKPSVDKDTIATLRMQYKHPIFDLILRQRSYSDGLSKIKSYLKFGGENAIINTNINTNRARTGRQSSSKPNLQNVSKKAALKNLFPVPLRKCFRADPGHVLLFVDYSGIEMRLIIESSGENELMDMLLLDTKADMHHPTVECFLGVKEAFDLRKEDGEQYSIQRSAFKNTGFCIAYGGSDRKVAIVLAKPLQDIIKGSTNYRKRFTRIDRFTENIIDEIKTNGYITTAFGRKLQVPKGKAYIGSNYMIQGTAAGILKRAQVNVAKFIKKELNNRIELVLPIHDEIVMSYPRSLLHRKDEILTEISCIMTDMPEITIPLEVEWKISTTDWNSAKDLVLEEG